MLTWVCRFPDTVYLVHPTLQMNSLHWPRSQVGIACSTCMLSLAHSIHLLSPAAMRKKSRLLNFVTAALNLWLNFKVSSSHACLFFVPWEPVSCLEVSAMLPKNLHSILLAVTCNNEPIILDGVNHQFGLKYEIAALKLLVALKFWSNVFFFFSHWPLDPSSPNQRWQNLF